MTLPCTYAEVEEMNEYVSKQMRDTATQSFFSRFRLAKEHFHVSTRCISRVTGPSRYPQNLSLLTPNACQLQCLFLLFRARRNGDKAAPTGDLRGRYERAATQ